MGGEWLGFNVLVVLSFVAAALALLTFQKLMSE